MTLTGEFWHCKDMDFECSLKYLLLFYGVIFEMWGGLGTKRGWRYGDLETLNEILNLCY
jgi:hypothetical protein